MQSLEDGALAQRQLGSNSKGGSSRCRGSTEVTGYTEVIRVDVKPARTKPHAPRTLGCAIRGEYGLAECVSSVIVVSY
jgi:hypothetical protein